MLLLQLQYNRIIEFVHVHSYIEYNCRNVLLQLRQKSCDSCTVYVPNIIYTKNLLSGLMGNYASTRKIIHKLTKYKLVQWREE